MSIHEGVKLASSVSLIGLIALSATPSFAQNPLPGQPAEESIATEDVSAAPVGNNATQGPQDEEALTEIVVSAQTLAVGESAPRVPIPITAVSTELVRHTPAVSIIAVGLLASTGSTQTPGPLPGFPTLQDR